MKRGKFIIGLLIGALLGLLFWYYQKSTSAEDGALDLLDRLSQAETRVRELERLLRQQETAAVAPSAPRSDDLTRVNGIGPVYAARLNEAGIQTFAELAGRDADELRAIVGLKEWHAADPAVWIAQASELSG